MLQSARIAIRVLSISILAVFLTAAFAEDHYTKSKEPVFPQVQPGHALVYVARPDFTRLIPEGTFKVFVDSTPVGWLPQRSYIAVQVDPGSRVVWGPANRPQRFEFQAGKAYLLVLVEEYGANRAIVAASFVPGDPVEVQAFVADKKLTYVEANADSLAALRDEGEKKFGKQEQRAPEVHAAPQPTTAAPPPVKTQTAPPAAASGELVPYEGQKTQFTLSLPRGWVVYDQSALPGVGSDPRFNLIVFYLSPNPGAQDSMAARLDEMSAELMSKIDTGESPSFFLQRFPARKGMSCDGFTEGAEKEVIKVVAGDAAFRRGATIQEALHSEPLPFAGCKGLRIRGTGQPAGESNPQTSDVFAACDGKTLYLFSLRSHADYYKKNLEPFQKSMATAKLTTVQ